MKAVISNARPRYTYIMQQARLRASASRAYTGHMGTKGGTKNEKPRQLGDRVYKKHRRMMHAIARKLRMPQAELLRLIIEEAYVRIVRGK